MYQSYLFYLFCKRVEKIKFRIFSVCQIRNPFVCEKVYRFGIIFNLMAILARNQRGVRRGVVAPRKYKNNT